MFGSIGSTTTMTTTVPPWTWNPALLGGGTHAAEPARFIQEPLASFEAYKRMGWPPIVEAQELDRARAEELAAEEAASRAVHWGRFEQLHQREAEERRGIELAAFIRESVQRLLAILAEAEKKSRNNAEIVYTPCPAAAGPLPREAVEAKVRLIDLMSALMRDITEIRAGLLAIATPTPITAEVAFQALQPLESDVYRVLSYLQDEITPLVQRVNQSIIECINRAAGAVVVGAGAGAAAQREERAREFAAAEQRRQVISLAQTIASYSQTRQQQADLEATLNQEFRNRLKSFMPEMMDFLFRTTNILQREPFHIFSSTDQQQAQDILRRMLSLLPELLTTPQVFRQYYTRIWFELFAAIIKIISNREILEPLLPAILANVPEADRGTVGTLFRTILQLLAQPHTLENLTNILRFAQRIASILFGIQP